MKRLKTIGGEREESPDTYQQTVVEWAYAFDRPIAFHRSYVAITGSVTAALMLSQAHYWQLRSSQADFWKTYDEWHEETGMSRRELETARKILVGKGFLTHTLSGCPAKSHYQVDFKAIYDALVSSGWETDSPVQTSMAESAKLDCTNPPNLNGGIRQTKRTETTPETSSETIKHAKVPREAYGEFGKVRLSADESAKLANKFGVTKANELIEAVDTWAQSNGKYKPDWYATILNWAKNEGKYDPKNGRGGQVKDKTLFGSAEKIDFIPEVDSD
jgi:hypothetical protein